MCACCHFAVDVESGLSNGLIKSTRVVGNKCLTIVISYKRTQFVLRCFARTNAFFTLSIKKRSCHVSKLSPFINVPMCDFLFMMCCLCIWMINDGVKKNFVHNILQILMNARRTTVAVSRDAKMCRAQWSVHASQDFKLKRLMERHVSVSFFFEQF